MIEGAKDEIASTDDVLAQCRQGDCFIAEHGFVQLAIDGADECLEEELVAGLVLVTQTCDVVRQPASRPSVVVSPLVQVEDAQYALVVKGYVPRYVAIPLLADKRLVADLDRLMTVDKAAMVRWKRVSGVADDAQRRAFATALARKYSRFAFPDDFNAYVAPLTRRLREKHDKSSPEGNALRALAEIRVLAEPSWDAPEVALTFYFVKDQDAPAHFEGTAWQAWMDRWLALLANATRFKSPDGVVLDYGTMIVAEHRQSDQLDLEHLSH